MLKPLLPDAAWVVATRQSPLALWQTQFVMDRLKSLYPKALFEMLPTKTTGDLNLSDAIGSKSAIGVFVKELETALLEGKADLAVHSLKDLPAVQPEGLSILPILSEQGFREAAGDVLLSVAGKNGPNFWQLPAGARVGTSARRRVAQLKRLRDDLVYVPMRGNLQTRWRKLEEGAAEALVLAEAGVNRLGWQNRISHRFNSLTELLPAPGQGVLAVEYRTTDTGLAESLQPLTSSLLQTVVLAERTLMQTLEGGCQVPLAAYCEVPETLDGPYCLHAELLSADGSQCLRGNTLFHSPQQAQSAAKQLAQTLLSQGGQAIREGAYL